MSDKIREAFEEWRTSKGWTRPYDPGEWEAWQAAIARQPAQVLPEGWKLVPVKPDIEMVEAGYEASLGQPDRSGHARVIEVYDAMLAATPPAAEQPYTVKVSLEQIARAIWNVLREYEDRCDMELEDMPRGSKSWEAADAVMSLLAGGEA